MIKAASYFIYLLMNKEGYILRRVRYIKLTTVVIGCLLITTSFVLLPAEADPSKSKKCRGSVSINGSTNVNKFVLKNDLARISIKRTCNKSDSLALLTKKYWFTIPVRNFKADNQHIYKDFLSLIRAREYPEIKVGFTLKDLHRLMDSKTPISFPVDISLAGTTKSYDIICRFSSCEDNCFSVSGSKKLALTDFNIEPPQKILGLIRVNNEININFDFVFTFQN